MATHKRPPRIFRNGEEAQVIVHNDEDWEYGQTVVVVWRDTNGDYLVVDPDYFNDTYNEENAEDYEYEYDHDETHRIAPWKLGRIDDIH